MPLLFVRTCNSDFHCRDEGSQYESPEDALAMGIEGAVDIARDEIQKGASTVAVEVCVEREDGKKVLRSVVSLSISPLSVEAESAKSENAASKRPIADGTKRATIA